ncbi:MAG: Ldh family oxidoreductase, partial [Hyphomicrobiaceae bacterium]
RITLEDVYQISMRALQANGADERNAEEISRVIWAAERDGCHSHGLFRLPWYIGTLRKGRANGAAQPRVEDVTPAIVRVNANDGFAPLAFKVGTDPLVERARSEGMAALAIVQCQHIGALWYETTLVAEQGLVALAMTSAKPMVAPAGGTKPFFGTNPLAFAWPRVDKPPMVFDMATAAMARGEIQIAARDGHRVPEGAGIDADGNPTTDPNAILAGAQLAFGGTKGALLALMVELMVGPMLGQPFSVEQAADAAVDDGTAIGGEFVLAIDPVRLSGNDGALDHGERLFEALLAQEGTRLPGDRRYNVRDGNHRDGVEIPTELYETIMQFA